LDLAESWLLHLGTDPSPLPALSAVEGAQDDGLLMALSSHVFELVHAYSCNSYLGKKPLGEGTDEKAWIARETYALLRIH